MRDDLDHILKQAGGVGDYADLAASVGKSRLDNEIRRGRLRAVFPRAYAWAWDVDDRDVRDLAAVVSVGGDAALAGVSALRRRALPAPADQRIHVIVSRTSRPRSRQPDLVVHRTKLPTPNTSVDGIPTQSCELAVAWAWVALTGADRRAPAITAVREGMTTPGALAVVARRALRMKGRQQLLQLCELLVAGCESELEVWGYAEVFDVPGLRHATRQHRVRVGNRVFRLDMAYEQARLAVELDGRGYHAADDQWERDIRRDLALATVGWQTVRLSHRRLTTDMAGCRRDVLRVLASRTR